MASLLDFLEAVGTENIACQLIHQCVTAAQIKRGGGTEVKFITCEITPTDLTGKMRRTGFIVWMDADKFDAALMDLEGK
ncbi:hypothetical protein [Klebsiella pneumoniae]|uniref:hypothetical protein n=1 Tax=Klebsiella pneumoniae TaxID=573 RepID=UPI0037507EA6